jgi:hypothetical protein
MNMMASVREQQSWWVVRQNHFFFAVARLASKKGNETKQQ